MASVARRINFKIHNNYYVVILLVLVANIIVISLFFLVRWLLNANEPLCGMVPFKSWANEPMLREEELETPVGLVVVTHTVTPDCTTDDECRTSALYIRFRHMNNGFIEIPLSFMVGGNGKIYEGAAFKVGAHTSGFNNRSISLSFMGDFREQTPTQEALNVAEEFLECLLKARYLTDDYNVVGHRQLINTISPGDALQNLIQTWPRWVQNVT